MKKILIPVDFSEYSEYALEVAATIAKTTGAEIIVLHMMGLSESIFTKDESQEFMEAQYYMRLAKKRFASFLNHEYLQGIKVSEMVQNYKRFDEINTIAKELHIDLVIMGSHGVGGMVDIFVGSNTEKVVRTSEVPVLVIKKRMPDFKIKRIVLAWHFKDENVLVYRKLRDFAAAFDAILHLVYINLPAAHFMSSKQIEDRIAQFMENTGIKKEVAIYNDYSVEEGLLQYARKIEADLVAVPTHGRKGLSHFLVGSIGEDVANHAQLPVLTLKM
ncbi:universal stress protein [Flavobacteriaceae bacterium TP-CH-4]|uniref:Universal stress protein n=1 Tax=Pelagihabitans pacificus TaxID=2696054 RepID=A0A967AV27_9FLAO|nr:universal stress protein [Pelagihabitans pacificus]NHF59710.1 universal stress protein [Pelagihabitans pacificus]